VGKELGSHVPLAEWAAVLRRRGMRAAWICCAILHGVSDFIAMWSRVVMGGRSSNVVEAQAPEMHCLLRLAAL